MLITFIFYLIYRAVVKQDHYMAHLLRAADSDFFYSCVSGSTVMCNSTSTGAVYCTVTYVGNVAQPQSKEILEGPTRVSSALSFIG